MVSAFKNPTMPPLMSPESQKPGLFAIGKANFRENMKDPRKSAILQSMLLQSLGQMGGGLLGGGQMGNRPGMARPAFNPMDMAMLMRPTPQPAAPPPMPTQAMPAAPTMPATPPMPPKDPSKSPLAQYRANAPTYRFGI